MAAKKQREKVEAWSEQEVLGFIEDLLDDQINEAGIGNQLKGGYIEPGGGEGGFILVTPPNGARFRVIVQRLEE
jgi:hypothetical protein